MVQNCDWFGLRIGHLFAIYTSQKTYEEPWVAISLTLSSSASSCADSSSSTSVSAESTTAPSVVLSATTAVSTSVPSFSSSPSSSSSSPSSSSTPLSSGLRCRPALLPAPRTPDGGDVFSCCAPMADVNASTRSCTTASSTVSRNWSKRSSWRPKWSCTSFCKLLAASATVSDRGGYRSTLTRSNSSIKSVM